jgi:hypothetical protein
LKTVAEKNNSDENFFTFKKKSEKPQLDPTKYFLQNRTFDNPSVVEFE